MPDRTKIKAPVAVGEVVGGKYRVGEVLGAGGMGVVVAGEHLSLRQRVAIKFMRPEGGPQALHRFHREANVVVQLKSEHVCRVMDHGTIASGDMYIVMELLEGRDLDQLVRESGRVPVVAAVEYLLQACEPLAEAHLLGVVHRDLKPSNLFLTQRPDHSPCIKLLDFGISKVREPVKDLTATGSLLGSVHFMSPEQLDDASTVDLRSDIWSLGATLYELLVGTLPFDADSLSEMAIKIMYDPVHDFESMAPELRGIAPVVKRCLAKKPEDRYANLADLTVALAPFASDRACTYVERIVGMYERTGWKAPSGFPLKRISHAPVIDPDELAATLGHVASPEPLQAHTATIPRAGGPQSAGLPAFVPQSAPRPEKAKKGRRGVMLGLVSLVALGTTGLWLFERNHHDEAGADDDSEPSSKKKKKKKPGKTSADPAAPPTLEPLPGSSRVPGPLQASWYQANAIFSAVVAARDDEARVALCRFYKSYAEFMLVANMKTFSLERFIWQNGKLLRSSAPFDEPLASEKHMKEVTVKLGRLQPLTVQLLPGRMASEAQKIAEDDDDNQEQVTSIELVVKEGKAYWDVRTADFGVHHFDDAGNYLGNK